MPEAEGVYSAKQAAAQLGLSPAMTRRYGAALEEVTGEPIRQLPRDGRQYRSDQLAVMLQAKAYVESNPRLTVTDALKVALGLSSEPIIPEVATTSQVTPKALSGAFSQALEQTLMPELRELRAEVTLLRQQLVNQPSQGIKEVSQETSSRDSSDDDTPSQTQDGMLVHVARRLERLLGRRS